jgi:hypothetical protein
VTAGVIERLQRTRRALARPPLRQLIQWTLVHAMRPFVYGPPATRSFVAMLRAAVARRFSELADAGAFLYFGIMDAADFGEPEIGFLAVDGDGTIAVDAEPLIAWVFGGGARGVGWRRPDELTEDDLR